MESLAHLTREQRFIWVAVAQAEQRWRPNITLQPVLSDPRPKSPPLAQQPFMWFLCVMAGVAYYLT